MLLSVKVSGLGRFGECFRNHAVAAVVVDVGDSENI